MTHNGESDAARDHLGVFPRLEAIFSYTRYTPHPMPHPLLRLLVPIVNIQGRSVTLLRFFILTKNEYKNALLTEFSSKLG